MSPHEKNYTKINVSGQIDGHRNYSSLSRRKIETKCMQKGNFNGCKKAGKK
jgi:hypothetical protein